VVLANSSNVVGVVLDLERGSALMRPESIPQLISMVMSAACGERPPFAMTPFRKMALGNSTYFSSGLPIADPKIRVTSVIV
jgi:hypothetical protein